MFENCYNFSAVAIAVIAVIEIIVFKNVVVCQKIQEKRKRFLLQNLCGHLP